MTTLTDALLAMVVEGGGAIRIALDEPGILKIQWRGLFEGTSDVGTATVHCERRLNVVEVKAARGCAVSRTIEAMHHELERCGVIGIDATESLQLAEHAESPGPRPGGAA